VLLCRSRLWASRAHLASYSLADHAPSIERAVEISSTLYPKAGTVLSLLNVVIINMQDWERRTSEILKWKILSSYRPWYLLPCMEILPLYTLCCKDHAKPCTSLGCTTLQIVLPLQFQSLYCLASLSSALHSPRCCLLLPHMHTLQGVKWLGWPWVCVYVCVQKKKIGTAP